MIGLSPLPTGHPLRFQPKWVRPSTESYLCFSLPMDRSPGFASTTYDYDAILKARFHYGSFQNLTSPHIVTRWLILQKARRHAAMGAPTACRHAVSGTVSLPSRGAFHLSFTVLYAIGHWVVFRVGGWSPHVPTRFHVSGRTLELAQLSSFSPTGFSPSLIGLPMPFG